MHEQWAMHGRVNRGIVKRGERLVVIAAAAGVGRAAFQVGRLLSAEVVAIASSEAKHDFAIDLCASAVTEHGMSQLVGKRGGASEYGGSAAGPRWIARAGPCGVHVARDRGRAFNHAAVLHRRHARQHGRLRCAIEIAADRRLEWARAA